MPETLLGDNEWPLYPRAIQVVWSTGHARISTVQQHMRIGYNLAARLLDQMERDGLVSPMNLSGERRLTELIGARASEGEKSA